MEKVSVMRALSRVGRLFHRFDTNVDVVEPDLEFGRAPLLTGGKCDNDPNDAVSKDQIRHHLEDIARAFSEGRFEAPVEIHHQMPPGATVMQDLKSAIGYRFEPKERGGRGRITTTDVRALKAVHDFLRFQIKEHQTGDPLSVVSK